jgi:hypothetical protein
MSPDLGFARLIYREPWTACRIVIRL